MMMDTNKGSIRVRRWPRKRGKPKTTGERERQEQFRIAQLASKYFDPNMMARIIEMTQNSPLLPRDITTMMLYGRLNNLITIDGKVLWNVAARQDVSESLDTITQAVGDTLRRGTSGWEGSPAAPAVGFTPIAKRTADGSSRDFGPIPGCDIGNALLLLWNGRTTANANNSHIELTANNDVNANYSTERWNTYGRVSNVASTYIDLGAVCGTAQSSPEFSPGFAVMPLHMEAPLTKGVIGTSFLRVNNDPIFNTFAGTWRNTTNGIERLRFRLANGNWAAGSTLAIYALG